MITVTATEIQNNFGKYLQAVQDGNEILITKNGAEVARLISRDAAVSSLSSAFLGVLKSDYDEKEMRKERINRREGID